MWNFRKFRRSLKRLRDLRREEGAVAAVEFALVAAPFFYLLLGIIETGYIFFISIMLEDAASEGARQVRTGEVKLAGAPATELRDAVCNNVFILVRPCTDLVYEVTTNYTSFQTIMLPALVGTTLTPGNPGDIVVVRVSYSWNYITPLLQNVLDAVTPGHLVSRVAFRNEPYPLP